MKFGGGEDNEENEEPEPENENEKEDMKNIIFSIKSPSLDSKFTGKKTNRGYQTTKNNIKKPLSYFKICNFCGQNENICDCSLLLKGESKHKEEHSQKSFIIQNIDIEYKEKLTYYKYKPLPPKMTEILKNIKDLQNYSTYQ